MDISAIMELFTTMIDLRVSLFCLIIGIIVKYLTAIDNKFIIPINILFGVLIAVWAGDFAFTFDIVLSGACSGLFATSIYEAAIKKLFSSNG